MTRTVMVVLAVTVDTDEAFPQTADVFEMAEWLQAADRQEFLDASVVSVWDRNKPESDQNPQVFAAYRAPLTAATNTGDRAQGYSGGNN